LPDIAVQSGHHAGDRRRDIHCRFVRHDINEQLIFLDALADAHMPRGDFRFGNSFSDIRQMKYVAAHRKSSIERCNAVAMR
jgi:hypothetical protein